MHVYACEAAKHTERVNRLVKDLDEFVAVEHTYWYKKTGEHTDRPDKFYDTFKPFIQQQRQGINITTSVKTKENNVEKNQNEAAETLASYFKNAALNIGGGHVSRLTEDHHSEHDSVKSIREVYEENDFDFKLLTPNEVQRAGHLKTSI